EGALSFRRDQFRHRLLSGGKTIVLHLLEASDIGLRGPDGRLRDLRCGAYDEQRRKQQAKKGKGRHDASAWKHKNLREVANDAIDLGEHCIVVDATSRSQGTRAALSYHNRNVPVSSTIEMSP